MPLLNAAVRWYLSRCPITEGKAAILRMTKRRIAPADPEVTARTKHGFDIHLNLRNPEHERIYYYGEHDERYEIALLQVLVKSGWTCWDIGANIGFYTCLFSRLVGEQGRVVAFEPMTATRERLLRNIAINDLQNAAVSPYALGALDEQRPIYFGDDTLAEGTASMLTDPTRGKSEMISVARLDSISATLPKPDLIKIDVEGAQLDVWRGGENFLRQTDALILAELRDSKDPAILSAIERNVRAAGFAIYSIQKHCRVRSVRTLDHARHRNYFLARPGTAAHADLESRVLPG